MKANDKAYAAARKVAYNRINKCFVFDLIKEAVDAAYAAQFQSEDYAGLIARLRICESNLPGDRTLWYRNPNGPDAADALEALLAERDALKAERDADRAHRVLAAELHAAAMSTQRDIAIRERDALKAELAKAQKLAKLQAERIGDYIKKIEDRDALLTLLAPVDDDSRHLTTDEQKIFRSALRRYAKIKKPVNNEVLLAERDAMKAVVEIYEKKLNGIEDEIRLAAQSAIAAVRPHIEAAERERCAKVVEKVAEKINVAHHERPEWEDGYLQGVHDAAAAIRSGK